MHHTAAFLIAHLNSKKGFVGYKFLFFNVSDPDQHGPVTVRRPTNMSHTKKTKLPQQRGQEAVVAEWLRRLTRITISSNQIPSGSVGSNPTDCESILIKLTYSLHIGCAVRYRFCSRQGNM